MWAKGEDITDSFKRKTKLIWRTTTADDDDAVFPGKKDACHPGIAVETVTHRMFEPAVLDDWTHLLVHDHILQILQGGMLAYFILKRQHVLAN